MLSTMIALLWGEDVCNPDVWFYCPLCKETTHHEYCGSWCDINHSYGNFQMYCDNCEGTLGLVPLCGDKPVLCNCDEVREQWDTLAESQRYCLGTYYDPLAVTTDVRDQFVARTGAKFPLDSEGVCYVACRIVLFTHMIEWEGEDMCTRTLVPLNPPKYIVDSDNTYYNRTMVTAEHGDFHLGHH